MSVHFTVPLEPVAQPRHRACVRSGKVHTYEAAKDHPVHVWKQAVRLYARQAMRSLPPYDGPVGLKAVFVLPRAKREKCLLRRYHGIRPDCENLVKSLQDAMSGIVWRDDSQVAAVQAFKMVASAHEQPHAEVEVVSLEDAP